MFNCQEYGVDIELEMMEIFNCEKHGYGDMVCADIIRKHPVTSMMCGLTFLYASESDIVKKNEMEKFILDYRYYLNFSTDELFHHKTADLNGFTMEFKNGETALKSIFEDFKNLVR